VSKAAGGKFQPSGGGYEVARPQGQCSGCGRGIEPEQKFMAALVETSVGFGRVDCCAECWPKQERKDVVAFWQASMPRPEQKKKLFVDDTVLCELFERLADVSEPAKVNFRFVLGLILMRKRLLIYETTRQETDREIWSMRMKGREEWLDLVNPRLNETQIKEVSQQLGEILQQEL
jgi:hypothetical protein